MGVVESHESHKQALARPASWIIIIIGSIFAKQILSDDGTVHSIGSIAITRGTALELNTVFR